MVLYFDGRELKQYGEFVKAVDLVEGRVYFRVSFLDQDTVIPELVPLVFVGRDLHPDQLGLYFQDASSYLAGERYDPADWVPANSQDELPDRFHRGREVWFETMAETEFASVLEFEQGLNLLLVCSVRRRSWDGQVRQIQPPKESGDEH